MLLIRHSHCPEGDSTAWAIGAVYGDGRACRGLLAPQRGADLAKASNQGLIGEYTRACAGVGLRRAVYAIGRSELPIGSLGYARPCATRFKIYPVSGAADHVASLTRVATVWRALVPRGPQLPHKRTALECIAVTERAWRPKSAASKVAPITERLAWAVHSASNNNCICHD